MRALVSSFIGLVLVLIAFGNAFAAEEEILSFHSEITIHEDSTVTIVETIVVQATGNKIRRGIYRDFPTVYKDSYGNTVRVGFEVWKALRDADPVFYWIEDIVGGKRVYLGNKNRFISPGRYAFQLTYKTNQQIGYYEDFDELAWNVTGDQWDFPILKATAEIHLPPGASVNEKVAYTGAYGSTEQAVLAETETPRKVRFQSTRVLQPGEGMTVAVSWPKGFVEEPTKAEGTWLLLQANADLAAASAGFVLVLGFYLIAWAYVGRDPKAGTIIPRFRPPEGLSPAAMRYLVQTKFDDATFSVAIISIAVKGVIRIEEAEGTYTLFKESSDWKDLSEGEISVMKALFPGDRPSIGLVDSNHVEIGLARNHLEDVLEEETENVYLKNNGSFAVAGIFLSGLAVVATLFASSSVNDDVLHTGSMAVLAIPAIAIFRKGWFLIVKTLFLMAKFGFARFLPYAFGLLLLLFLVTAIVSGSSSWFTLGFTIATGLLPILFNYLLKAPTIKGRDMLDKILGFKLYLSVAEKERLEAMHPPEETPELFERYMPYAIALEVGDVWNKRFANHLSASSIGESEFEATDYRPRWYSSRRWSRRSLTGLGPGLGTSLTKSVGLAATPPASSSRDSFTGGKDGFSSGGFSGGFGGGGFSGGGGGGGGGGGF